MPSVVAGIDAGPLARAVVSSAAEEAVRRGLALDLVTVVVPGTVPEAFERWTVPRPDDPLLAAPRHRESAPDWQTAREHLTAAAQEAVARWPELTVRTWCLAEDDLEDPAATGVRLPLAAMLVVGALGRKGDRPFGLRSISRLLAKRMGCPVLVVPGDTAPGATAPVLAGIHDRRDVEVLRTAVTESGLRQAPLVVVLVLGEPADPGPHGLLDDIPVPPRTRVIAVAHEDVAAALVRVAEDEDAQVLVIGTTGAPPSPASPPNRPAGQ